MASAIVGLFLKERPDDHGDKTTVSRGAYSGRRFRRVRHDRNFRTVTIIAALFGMYLTLFPHYQRLGRDRLELGLTALIPWVLAQNIGAALFSIPAGWIADRFGNRLVLRLMMLVLCVAPVLALWLARMGDAGQPWFTMVFFLLGLTPVTMRILNKLHPGSYRESRAPEVSQYAQYRDGRSGHFAQPFVRCVDRLGWI